MAAKRTGSDALENVHSDEGALETPCSNLLTRLPDDQFVHIISLFSLHCLISLRILSIEIKARIDELSLKITPLGARLFPHVRLSHGFLELPGEKIASLLRHPNLTASTAEEMESAMVWLQHRPTSRLSCWALDS